MKITLKVHPQTQADIAILAQVMQLLTKSEMEVKTSPPSNLASVSPTPALPAKAAAVPASKPIPPAIKPAATPATTPAAKPATVPATKPATVPAAKPVVTPTTVIVDTEEEVPEDDAVVVEEDVAPEPVVEGITADQLRVMTSSKAQAGHFDAIKKFLAAHNANNVTSLKPDFYQEYFDFLSTL